MKIGLMNFYSKLLNFSSLEGDTLVIYSSPPMISYFVAGIISADFWGGLAPTTSKLN